MYDPYNRNIYLINYINVYNRLTVDNYRIPDNYIIDTLEKKLLKSKNDVEYYEKLEKNIKFINNYDLDILENTVKKIIYDTNPILQELTKCEKKSFLRYQVDSNNKIINPYFKKSELNNLKKIYKIDINKNKNKNENICDIINDFEINSTTLLYHQIYLNHNMIKPYIQYYSLLGSFLFNNYMRNSQFVKDTELESHIYNFYNIIAKAPSFDKNYVLFRFINNSDYLQHLKINDIFYENSFISTTRYPFLNFKVDMEDLYLIKINIPKNVNGIGLSIEAYSLFTYEMEIILNPSKLMLKNIITKKNKPIFFHPNSEFEERIVKIYEFDFIESIDFEKIKLQLSKYKLSDVIIPFYNFYDLENKIFFSNTTNLIINEFISSLNKLNSRKIIKININDIIYQFDVNFVIDNSIYYKFFFLKKNHNYILNNSSAYSPVIYLTLLNNLNGAIELIIEISSIISVNYIHKYSGLSSNIADDDLINFLSHLSYHFKIDTIIIHSKYNSYLSITETINKHDKDINIEDITTKFINLYEADTTYFSQDFINYIEFGNKRFNDKSIHSVIKYHQIDDIFKINPMDVIINNTTDLIYKIYRKHNFETFKELYLYLHYNNPLLINEINKLLNNYILKNNINTTHNITKLIYILKPYNYLYNKKKISYFPVTQNSIENLLNNYVNETQQFFRTKYKPS
jgi:hypothetical protein